MTSHTFESDRSDDDGDAMSPAVICAWCKSVIGRLEGESQSGENSHGICPECYAEQVESLTR